MPRVAVTMVGILIGVWMVANVFALGPLETATGAALAWVAVLALASVGIAMLTAVAWGLVCGRTSPAWRRFLHQARTAAAVGGVALVVVGLLRWRDTEPNGDLTWLVLGLGVLATAVLVHGWLTLAGRGR